MLKRFVYKNVNDRPVKIGKYQFQANQKIGSDVVVDALKESVDNGFLELIDRRPEEGDSGTGGTEGQQDKTGKVTVIFHFGLDAEGKDCIEEKILDPKTRIEFPGIDLMEGETFDGWYTDAEFKSAQVNVDKAKTPKDPVDVHFYGKFTSPVATETKPDSEPDSIGDPQVGDDNAGEDNKTE
jgi:hypothetical protein